MHLAHHCAEQPFDMTAVMRFAPRAPNDIDAFIATTANERLASEIRAIVDVKGFRQTGDRPCGVDLTFLQPSCLVVNAMEKAEADGKSGRGIPIER